MLWEHSDFYGWEELLVWFWPFLMLPLILYFLKRESKAGWYLLYILLLVSLLFAFSCLIRDLKMGSGIMAITQFLFKPRFGDYPMPGFLTIGLLVLMNRDQVFTQLGMGNKLKTLSLSLPFILLFLRVFLYYR